MKNRRIYSFVILIVFLMISIFSYFSNKANPPYVHAFDLDYYYFGPPIYPVSPNLINDFDSVHAPYTMKYSPVNSEYDYKGWQGGTKDNGVPLSYMTNCGGGVCAGTTDTNCPPAKHGQGYMRVSWSGNTNSSPQFVHLTNYAETTNPDFGQNFENTGCYVPKPVGIPTAGPSPTPVTVHAGDMSCYGYIKFYLYFNVYPNGGSAEKPLYQNAAIYDGNVTITGSDLPFVTQGAFDNSFSTFYSMSLNYLANQYDVTTGRYFGVSTVTDIIINAPKADYSKWPTLAGKGFESLPSFRSIIMYYDFLSLGAKDSLPVYDSPSPITVTTAYDNGTPLGALVSWPPQTTYDPAVPVTAYHVYRSLTLTSGGDPFVSVGIVKAGTYPLCLTDTAVIGGNTYCYKVLTCNNGPVDYDPSDENKSKGNTVNANYHEPLLYDPVANTDQVCGYIDPMPTQTNTPTPENTPCTGICGTATPSPTFTATPAPPDLIRARVYPNPFNPNMGSKFFYVDNTPPDTKVFIYAMDGALVKSGKVLATTNNRFEWNGKNNNGSKVVSGLYYLVLESSDKKTRVFRIIVCYKCESTTINP